MIDNSYYEVAKENLEKIEKINSYIMELENFIYLTSTNFNNLKKENEKSTLILSQINEDPCVGNLDKYHAFWIYEICKSPNDQGQHYNGLLSKLAASGFELKKIQHSEGSRFTHKPIKKLLTEMEAIRVKYVLEDDHVVVLTAVPVEFKAFLRKITFIINVFDRNYTEKIVNPDTSPQKLKERKKTWVEGVIIRNNLWVKVRLILTEHDGSVSALKALNEIEPDYNFPNEILLIGVAGQLDKKEEVKIGDLVISDKYYRAYGKPAEKKVDGDSEKEVEDNIENTVSYEDTTPRILSDDYDVEGSFNWEVWTPSHMLELKPPPIYELNRYSQESNVFKGAIACVPTVVKQRFNKELLRNKFEGALAVEMETYGCHEFAKSKNIKLKVIKSICDWSTPDKEKTMQPYCADLASEFAVDYLIAKYGKIVE